MRREHQDGNLDSILTAVEYVNMSANLYRYTNRPCECEFGLWSRDTSHVLQIRSRVIVDCTGHNKSFVQFHEGREPGYQVTMFVCLCVHMRKRLKSATLCIREREEGRA